MSVPSGLPGGGALARFMRCLPLAATVDFSGLQGDAAQNPLLVAQTICGTDAGLREPLHAAVADRLRELEAGAVPSAALRSLAATPNRAALILTLNYDRLVQRAAEMNGRPVQTLGVDDIPDLLNDGLYDPDETLRVLHLHGTLEDPPWPAATSAQQPQRCRQPPVSTSATGRH
jgi:SIR2-like protein